MRWQVIDMEHLIVQIEHFDGIVFKIDQWNCLKPTFHYKFDDTGRASGRFFIS